MGKTCRKKPTRQNSKIAERRQNLRGKQGKNIKLYTRKALRVKINEPTADKCINYRFSYGAGKRT